MPSTFVRFLRSHPPKPLSRSRTTRKQPRADDENCVLLVLAAHTAGRYAKKQFAKGRMPIVERLVNRWVLVGLLVVWLGRRTFWVDDGVGKGKVRLVELEESSSVEDRTSRALDHIDRFPTHHHTRPLNVQLSNLPRPRPTSS
jgi:hypothetical protein